MEQAPPFFQAISTQKSHPPAGKWLSTLQFMNTMILG